MKRRANIVLSLLLCGMLALVVCGASSQDAPASGAAWSAPETMPLSSFDASAASWQNDAGIDVSHAADGYVGASATSNARQKLQVTSGQMSYNYDLPSDGTPIIVPLNMGDGSYEVRVMRNTSQSNYVEIYAVTVDVELASEFAPYLVPNIFCAYDEQSRCVQTARELLANVDNEGEALEVVCTYIVENITYDSAKARKLSGTSGYVPSPDITLMSQTGICFDYASLGAAMLRSQGIPTRIMTGYVSPDEVYHAWIMVYVDGTWKTAQFSVDPNTWSRVDLTFAAADDNVDLVGDGKQYTDRYTY